MTKGRRPLPPEQRKRNVTLRLSPDLIDAIRATGAGWMARAEDALRKGFNLTKGE
jgi:uncharacterized protein (DUF4415 family)